MLIEARKLFYEEHCPSPDAYSALHKIDFNPDDQADQIPTRQFKDDPPNLPGKPMTIVRLKGSLNGVENHFKVIISAPLNSDPITEDTLVEFITLSDGRYFVRSDNANSQQNYSEFWNWVKKELKEITKSTNV